MRPEPRWLMHGIGLAGLLVLAACGQNNTYVAPPPPRVTVAKPVEQKVTRYFEATGNTAAVNSANLVARVQGFLTEIKAADGLSYQVTDYNPDFAGLGPAVQVARNEDGRVGSFWVFSRDPDFDGRNRADRFSFSFGVARCIRYRAGQSRYRQGAPAAGEGRHQAGANQSRLHQGGCAVRRRDDGTAGFGR